MTRFTRRALATATALTLLSTGASAFAAEAAPETGTEIAPVTEAAPAAGTIAVQLNGQDLAFTDAAPQAKDGRTFLPFRAVFEAMGAEVSYDAAANQVSATRGGTTVAMTLGSTEATVTAGGVTTPLTMDVAPYAADNRTYVPVRFAAQAFGCAVGWDQDDSTVILVDTAKLLEEAKAGHTYTYLDKYLAYNEQFTTGNWAMDANFNASVGLLGMGPATVAGTMTGVTAGATQMEAAMNMKLDLQALLEGIAAMTDTASEVDAETAALLDSLKNQGIDLELRGDLGGGTLYFTMSGDALAAAGMTAGTWYSMDLSALYGAMGMDYTALVDASKTLDAQVLLQSAMSGVTLTDKDADYAAIAALVDGAAKFLADQSFTADGANVTTTYTLSQDGADVTIGFTLVMENDAVVGYDLTMTAGTPASADGAVPAMTMDLKTGMDAQNQMTAAFTLDMGELLSMTMDLTGGYTATDETPALTPPEGAEVISYTDLLTGAMA